MPSETVYARMHKDYLRKNHPKMYKQLEASGELLEHCRRVGQQAKDYNEVLRAQMAASPNLLVDYAERVRELNAIPLIVEEIVQTEMIYTPVP